MAQQRLSATFASKVNAPGRYGDGIGSHGLALNVKKSASGRISKSWVQRLIIYSRPTYLGLGSFPAVTLAEARDAALDNVRTLNKGLDPRVKVSAAPSLEVAVESNIKLSRKGWKEGSRTERNMRGILRRNVPPALWKKPVNEITTYDILSFLPELTIEKPESARKLRQYLSQTFQWAVAHNMRPDDPTDQRIDKALAKPVASQHHRTIGYPFVYQVLEGLRSSNALLATKLGLEFLIWTAARSGEVRLARWDEIRAAGLLWQVPKERMKSEREHKVPLGPKAMAVIYQARQLLDGSGLIFPGPKGKPLSDATFSKLLSDLGADCVPHGFRATFRNWAHSKGEDDILAEQALAHQVGTRTERAYRTDDALRRRAAMMVRWEKAILVDALPPAEW